LNINKKRELFFKMQEGNLHQWFKGSKSKDDKKGYVNVVTGGTCASDEPGEGTPKCVSSSKRASMTPAERESAARRKKAADPNQQKKSNAAKPTYVSTDKPKKKMKEEMEITEADKKGKGSGKKDACYHKVKSRYSVWPSAYASGALVKCRKKGAANWGNSDKKEEFMALPEFTDLQINSMRKIGIEVEVLDEVAFERKYIKPVKLSQLTVSEDDDPCWNTHKQVGMKKKGSVKEEIFEKLRQDKKDTIEEATRIPAQNGNIYMVTFMWRGKLFYLKVFFPEVKRPNRKQVEEAINKVYPGAIVKYYDLTPTKQGDSYLYAGSHEGGDCGKKSDVFTMFGEDKEKNKSCPEGQYFCNKDNKCKSIPKGYRVMSNGTLVGDEDNNEDGSGDMSEDWQSTNKKDEVDGMGNAAIKAYRRENPGSKLKGAVTGDPKPASKDAKRRRSYCFRSKGQKDMHNIDCSKTPDKAICKARRRWKC
jgi:hypothetical protein